MKSNWVILLLFLCLANTSKAQSDNAISEAVPTRTISEQKIKVFPNPATNIVNVLGLINSDNSAISIVDTYGNIVLEHQWEIKNNALNIPVATLDSGIYIITIISKEQEVKTKFYKQ